MDDAGVVMRVIEGVAELARPFRQFMRFENLVRLVRAQIRKRVAVDVFHRDAARLVAVHEIVNPDDVLVSEIEAAPRLALHVAKDRAIVHDQLRQEFEGDVAFQFFIARQPHDAHAAAAQRLDQRVAIEDFLPAAEIADGRVEFATHGAMLVIPRRLLKEKIGPEIMEDARAALENLPAQNKNETQRRCLAMGRLLKPLLAIATILSWAIWQAPRLHSADTSP